jgi:hypothetical protein
MSEEKNYSIAVWDLTYYLVDEDGNAKKGEDGKVTIYRHPKEDASYLADGIDIEDLEEDKEDVELPMSIFATIKWDTADIASVRPDWDAEKVEEAAHYASRDLEDRSVEYGWETLDILLQMFEKGDKEDE